jgi:riboflavin kinase/FMN adenylyltransferase
VTVLHDFAGWPRGPLRLAIGVFDGVHVGHRMVVRAVAAHAASSGGTAIAATFDPLPIEVLAPGAPPSALTDIDERCALLLRAGAHGVVVFRFTREFAALTSQEFASRLAAAGEVRTVCVGEDFQFGRDRDGDVRALVELGAKLGFAVDIAPPVVRGGSIVSSTRIRNALVAGDVAEAARLLGRNYAVNGVVEHGDKRGRALGFPTVNLRVPSNRLLPRDGIYAVWARIGGDRVAAAASLGVRPTFGAGERRLEAFLLDWSGELYGDRVGIEFVRRLRDELRFASAAELSQQIAKDVEETRRVLRG